MQRLSHIIIFILFISISASAQQSEKVKLLCNWNDTTGLSNHNGQYFNDVWGFTVKGHEYAAVGSTEGVHIIDVSNCKQVAFQKGSTAGEHVIHRDYKIYKNYLYAVCDEGNDSRLQIFDISYLPDSLPQVYESTPFECIRSHNVFIDTAKAKMYLCFNAHWEDFGQGIITIRRPMSVFSLHDPAKPQFLTHFDYSDYIHDVYVRNDTAYASASDDGYVIVDFSKGTSYDILGILPDYDFSGYNHSSWINTKGIGVMADETHASPMKVIDTRETTDIKILSYFAPRPGDSTCIPHNPYILNDDYVLISYYFDGLQIYNISNPDSPYRTGFYDTYPGAGFKGYAGAWGCYPYLPSHRILLSDMQTGLYVFDADSALDLKAKNVIIDIEEPFSIYPNPAKDKLWVRLPSGQGPIEAAICDISGRTILKQSIYLSAMPNQGIELTLPRNCPVGMYTLRIVTGSNTYTGKFVKADN